MPFLQDDLSYEVYEKEHEQDDLPTCEYCTREIRHGSDYTEFHNDLYHDDCFDRYIEKNRRYRYQA